MKLLEKATLTLLFLVPVSAGAQPLDVLRSILDSHSERLIHEAKSTAGNDSKAAYIAFVGGIAKQLASRGETTLAKELGKDYARSNGRSLPKTAFSWITQAFAREYYKNAIIQATSELIKFKTFATDVPNRENTEFIKQKLFLRDLAHKLGLHFRDADGYVQEIWIGDAVQSLGLMVHSDVQPVDESGWERDPWSGQVVDDKLWGRGAIDDKGPLAAIMYGMRALLDSGLPLSKKIILLVGTDEESTNEDVSTYLKTHPAPDQTIVVDYSYPVICAEKGWCGLWLKLPRSEKLPVSEGVIVADIQSGYSASIVPNVARAKLIARGTSIETLKRTISDKIETFTKAREGGQLEVVALGDTLEITASGKTVHSSVPSTGHNALMDLLVFLNEYVQPQPNAIALMAKFAATYIGLELNGTTLGIAHHDDFMGNVTVAGNIFETSKDSVMFMFNFRIPKGIDLTKVEPELDARLQDFGDKHGVRFSDRRYLDAPLYNDPEGPFVQKLLSIYNRITGESRHAESMGGGTYAKRIPNAVVFGPKMPDAEYLGHQPNEHVKLSTLIRNIEILTYTMAEFAF